MTGSDRATAGGTPGSGVWGDPGFVGRWIAGDSGPQALREPRAISAALVADSGIEVRRVVDVGAGTGSYLRVMLQAFPAAEGTWIDASEVMLARARDELSDLAGRVRFVLGDLREAEALPLDADVIVSSRAVHHFRPDTIRSFYAAAAAALPAGGFLCNLDHFATPGDWRERYKRVKPGFVPTTGGGTEPHEHDAPPSRSGTTSGGSRMPASWTRTCPGACSGRPSWSAGSPRPEARRGGPAGGGSRLGLRRASWPRPGRLPGDR